jgi:hypothetical protein
LEQQTGKSIALRYGHIESALAEIMKVLPADAKAFHAGLRHFRNIGVPAGLPAPGKGQAIKYTRAQAFELLIAVSLQKAGYGPTIAGKIAGGLNEGYQQAQHQDVRDDVYGYVYSAKTGSKQEALSYFAAYGDIAKNIKAFVDDSAIPVITLLNLSELNRMLQVALDKQIYI